MFEPVRSRRLAQALAVLLGIVLWWPAAPRASFAQPQRAALSSNDEDPHPSGKLEQSNDAPGEPSEGEDSELEDGSLDQLAFVSPLHVSMSMATRIAILHHALPRLNAGYDALARERGPPIG